MASAAKSRANRERFTHPAYAGSSSGDTSSSGKATLSAQTGRSETASPHSVHSISAYDGNRDPGSPGSPPGSQTRTSPRSSGSGSPRSERNPATSRVGVDAKNLDLGAAAWSVVRGGDLCLPPRPAPSTLGQPIRMGINAFVVESYPSKPVYQYEVHIGNGAEKRGLMNKIWESKKVQGELGKGWLYDGNRLAWSLKEPPSGDIKLIVDLDQEQGRTPRPGKEENHRIVIRYTNKVGFATLKAYLNKQTDFDNKILEAINFFDHMLREWPRNKFTQIKRNFFARGEQRVLLGSGVEAFKGVYQSLRIVNVGSKAGLAIIVDVANGTFWTESQLHISAKDLTNRRDVPDLIEGLSHGENKHTAKELKKMRKLHVLARHRGGLHDSYVIDRFIFTSARDYKFEKDGKMVSIYDYFIRTYNVRLVYPELPLVKMTRGMNTLLPMEILKVKENQRYNYKLDEKQTSSMIRFAATPPPERISSIQHGLEMLSWDQDPVLNAFDTKINPNMMKVDARLITAPKVQFGQGEAKPGTSGRWDLKGKKFLTPNSVPLKSWGICVISGRRGGKPDKSTIESFIKEFIKIYQGHGGRVENKQPAMSLAQGDDVGAWVTATWNAAGNQSQARPQILVFILADKNPTTYGRIKRSGECRYGVVTQCMQYAHVQKAQAQYISNVCMKFNAKLGGQTARAIGPKSGGPSGLFTVPTVIIGADVSHAAPGSQNPSMAAMTMCMDKLGIRYAAACETNGFRMEMITTDNINSMLKPMLHNWVTNIGGGRFPARILYFRDGVSEGQYQHVLQQEVADMKALVKTADPKLDVQFVVIVGSKRHHVRFFPEQGKGDRNGNPLPGTLVESGVTHPFENDFYLCSHAAIKGTARPMHYHVLLNEASMTNEEIQTLIYEHCYQYIRATTPVSQHPAIYYAHIASNRAVPHDPRWSGSSDTTPISSSRPRSGSQGTGTGGPSVSSSGALVEFEKLMPMPNQGQIVNSMWYI